MSLISIFIIYQLLQIISLPGVIVYLTLRPLGRKPAFGNPFQRMGFVPKSSKDKKVFWLHAVSVGEMLSIQSLIKDIKEKIPNSECYLTTGTITAKRLAKTLRVDHVSLMPFDFLPNMYLAFRRIRPQAIVVVEAELWPNFLLIANHKKIPTYSLNARMSERSYRRYGLLKGFITPTIDCFKKIYVQSHEDKKRLKKIGIDQEKLIELGNLKALNVLEKHIEVKTTKQYPTILVGSVHPGEIDIYLELFSMLKSEIKNLKIIFAPRHFFWTKRLIKKVKATGFKFDMWDKYHTGGVNEAKNSLKTNDILLVCKLGILFDLYQLCTVYCLGGTFIPIGGHNLLEPSVWSKPSIIGPHHQNCKLTANALEKSNALIKVNNQRELIRQVRYLLKHEKLATQMGTNAKNQLEKEALIVQRNIYNLIDELQNKVNV